jgi:hypothetical protein
VSIKCELCPGGWVRWLFTRESRQLTPRCDPVRGYGRCDWERLGKVSLTSYLVVQVEGYQCLGCSHHVFVALLSEEVFAHFVREWMPGLLEQCNSSDERECSLFERARLVLDGKWSPVIWCCVKQCKWCYPNVIYRRD